MFQEVRASTAPDSRLSTREGARSARDQALMEELLESLSDIDKSNIIDSTSAQIAVCPKCYLEVDLRFLRKHIDNGCSEHEMTCPEIGCGATFVSYELKRHLLKECIIAKRRRNLVQAKAKRKKEDDDKLALQHQQLIDDAFRRADEEECAEVDATIFPTTEDHIHIPTLALCEYCGDSIKIAGDRMKIHKTYECRMRLVACPNARFGCGLVLPLAKMGLHLSPIKRAEAEREERENKETAALQEEELEDATISVIAVSTSSGQRERRPTLDTEIPPECEVEQRKELMAMRSEQRRQSVICQGCGQAVPLMFLRTHDAYICTNPRVPCKNRILGCHVMLRKRDRHLHETLASGRQIRSCLYLDGRGAHLSIKEDDVAIPWTAEFWLYRCSAAESAKRYIRSLPRLVALYAAAFASEKAVHDHLAMCIKYLKDASEKQRVKREDEDKKKERTNEERECLLKERVHEKSAAVREKVLERIQLLVPDYDASTLASTVAGQALQTSIVGALAAISEFIERPSSAAPSTKSAASGAANFPRYNQIPGDTPVNLAADITGEKLSLQEYATENFIAEEKLVTAKHQRDKKRTALLDGDGAADGPSDSVGAPPSKPATSTTTSILPTPSGTREKHDKKARNDKQAQSGLLSLVTNIEGSRKIAAPLKIFEPKSIGATASLLLSYTGDKYALQKTNILPVYRTAEEMFAPSSSFEELEEDVNRSTESDLSHKTRVLKNFYSAHGSCLGRYLSSTDQLRENNENMFLGYTNRSAVTQSAKKNKKISKAPAEKRKKRPDEYKGVYDLDAMLEDMTQADRAQELKYSDIKGDTDDDNEALTWNQWVSATVDVWRSLTLDQNTLQKWRVETNLSKKRDNALEMTVVSEDGSVRELTKDEIQINKKKEKDRLRRERRRSKHVDAKEDVAAGADNTSKVRSTRKSVSSSSNDAAASQAQRLQAKVKDVLLSCVGTDVLAFASSLAEAGGRSKLCIDMQHNQATLLAEALHIHLSSHDSASSVTVGGETKDATHNTAKKGGNDIRALNAGNPRVYTLPSLSPGSVGLVCCPNEGQQRPSSVGQFEGAYVPRQRWTHLAFVCTKRPKNRMSLYLDGEFCGHVRNSTFALPMGTLGAAIETGFQGCLLDVRYWCKQRSAAEIRATMHALINLQDMGQPAYDSKLQRDVSALSISTDADVDSEGPSSSRGSNLPNSARSDSQASTASLISYSREAAEEGETGMLSDSIVEFPQGLQHHGTKKLTRARFQDDDGPSRSSTHKEKMLNGAADSTDLSARGLISWWAFEDGYMGGGHGGDRARDISDHRYKTLITKRVDPAFHQPLSLERAFFGPPKVRTLTVPAGVIIPKATNTLTATGAITNEDSVNLVNDVVGAEASADAEPSKIPSNSSDLHEVVSTTSIENQDKSRDPNNDVVSIVALLPTQQEPDEKKSVLTATSDPSAIGGDLKSPHVTTPTSRPLSPSVGSSNAAAGRLTIESKIEAMVVQLLTARTRRGWTWLDTATMHYNSSWAASPPTRKASAGNGGERGTSKRSGSLNHRQILTKRQPEAGRPKSDPDGALAADPIVPVPSYRMRNICTFEIKRYRMAQAGRLLHRRVECPNGCGDLVRKFDVRFHCRHECELRTVYCRFFFCHASFLLRDKQKHEMSECKAVARRSELFDQYTAETAFERCSLCSEPLRARDMARHRKQECAHRLLQCEHDDCAKFVQAHFMSQHLRYDCNSASIRRRIWMVDRARTLRGYPRPWGLDVTMAALTTNEEDIAISAGDGGLLCLPCAEE